MTLGNERIGRAPSRAAQRPESSPSILVHVAIVRGHLERARLPRSSISSASTGTVSSADRSKRPRRQLGLRMGSVCCNCSCCGWVPTKGRSVHCAVGLERNRMWRHCVLLTTLGSRGLRALHRQACEPDGRPGVPFGVNQPGIIPRKDHRASEGTTIELGVPPQCSNRSILKKKVFVTAVSARELIASGCDHHDDRGLVGLWDCR